MLYAACSDSDLTIQQCGLTANYNDAPPSLSSMQTGLVPGLCRGCTWYEALNPALTIPSVEPTARHSKTSNLILTIQSVELTVRYHEITHMYTQRGSLGFMSVSAYYGSGHTDLGLDHSSGARPYRRTQRVYSYYCLSRVLPLTNPFLG